jgi:cell division protein FtsN
LGRARHEYRFGPRHLVLLGTLAVGLSAVTFALGLVIGRETAARRLAGPLASRPAAPEAGRGEGGSALPPDAVGRTAATRTEERLTFYRSLTAPTPDLPATGKPTIEERIVTAEEPEDQRGAPERPPAPARPSRGVPPPRGVPPALARALPVSPGPRPAPPAPAGLAPAEPTGWTVQVSSFRSRALAEELRARLATRGFEAYVLASGSDEARARYRVRVGAFPTRADAERTALELRVERGLSPIVTARAR